MTAAQKFGVESCMKRAVACQSTLPGHSWIKPNVNIQVHWLGGLLNRLKGVVHRRSIVLSVLWATPTFAFASSLADHWRVSFDASFSQAKRPLLTFCQLENKKSIQYGSCEQSCKNRLISDLASCALLFFHKFHSSVTLL